MPIEVKQKENPIYCSVIDFAILVSLTLSTQLDKTVSTRMNCATWTKKRLAHFIMTLWLLSRKEKKYQKRLFHKRKRKIPVLRNEIFFLFIFCLTVGGGCCLRAITKYPRDYFNNVLRRVCRGGKRRTRLVFVAFRWTICEHMWGCRWTKEHRALRMKNGWSDRFLSGWRANKKKPLHAFWC